MKDKPQKNGRKKTAERDLSESGARYRKLFEDSMDAIAITNSRGDIAEINDAGLKLLGYAGEEIKGLNFGELFLDKQKGREFKKELAEKGYVKGYPLDLVAKNGEVLNCIFNVQARRSEDGSITEYQGIIHDVSRQTKVQRALEMSEKKYRLVIENAPDAIFITREDTIVYMNETGKAALGYSEEELGSISAEKLIHPKDRDAIFDRHTRRLKEEGLPAGRPFRILTKDGDERWVQVNPLRTEWEGKPALLNFARDITEQKSLEEQLQRTQKMEAIGTLAGGIAHDFNNILAGIMGYAELLSFEIPEHTEAKTNLDKLLKSCHRAKTLVNQLLTFSRQGREKEGAMQVTPLVKECTKLLRSSLPSTIEIRQHISNDLGTINADPSEIQQLFMNLCTNAAQAMEKKGGVLDITLENAEIESRPADGHVSSSWELSLDPGRYVTLTVSDTGSGMSHEIMERIFDPYFSTRERSDGTGLGLSIVHSIAKRLGGGISVESRLSQGSSFKVYIPREDNEPDEGADPPDVVQGGHERILFVDDEETLVDIGSKMLSRLGYRVETATSGEAALQLFRIKPEDFDLVITDLTMPDMTGTALAEELARIRPDTPVILCTGYTESVSHENDKGTIIKAFIRKPLTMNDVSVAVRRILEG